MNIVLFVLITDVILIAIIVIIVSKFTNKFKGKGQIVKYIVVETFPIENSHVVTDEEGKPLIFDNYDKAIDCALELHHGVVVRASVA